MVKPNDYHKVLVYGKPLTDDPVCLENKTTQLKFLKAEKGKRTTFGDRMIGKGNKFANTVSGFANHRGGHIYYGVDDDGIVWGECVEDRNEIIRKVRKAVNKLVWLSDDGSITPIQGQHWDIFFEPVKDEKSRAINKIFVIVVYISYHNGGVFVTEPESYHIVEGEVVPIPIQEWKKRVLKTASQIHFIAKSHFKTTKSQDTYYTVMENMMDLRNQGGKGETFLKHILEQLSKNIPRLMLNFRHCHRKQLMHFVWANINKPRN